RAGSRSCPGSERVFVEDRSESTRDVLCASAPLQIKHVGPERSQYIDGDRIDAKDDKGSYETSTPFDIDQPIAEAEHNERDPTSKYDIRTGPQILIDGEPEMHDLAKNDSDSPREQ